MEVFPKAFQSLFLLFHTSGQGTRDKAPPPCSKKLSFLPATKCLLFALSLLLGLQAISEYLELGHSQLLTNRRWILDSVMSLLRGGFLGYLRLWQMFVGLSLLKRALLVRGEMKTFASPCSTFGVYARFCITRRGREALEKVLRTSQEETTPHVARCIKLESLFVLSTGFKPFIFIQWCAERYLTDTSWSRCF